LKLEGYFQAKNSWKLIMYAGAFMMDKNHGEREFYNLVFLTQELLMKDGLVLLLNSVPLDYLPYYRYFYDYHAGINAPVNHQKNLMIVEVLLFGH
jgi:hypothetical protein